MPSLHAKSRGPLPGRRPQVGHNGWKFKPDHQRAIATPLTLWLPSPHGKEPVGGIQRRRACHHHHHHGAGIEGAAKPGPRRVEAPVPGLPDLRAEFRLPRHLLEQPSSPVEGRRQGDRRDDVGESALAVLAVALPVCHRLDGRKSFHDRAHRGVRRRSAAGGHRLLRAAERHHCRPGLRLETGGGHRSRFQRQTVSRSLCRRRGGGIFPALDFLWLLRVGGIDVARSRPADRTPAGRTQRLTGGKLAIQFFRGSARPAVNRKRATSIAPRVPGISAATPVSASWK